MRSADDFAARLGLPIRDPDLLEQALTHSSYLHEHRDTVSGHNERLEFLGDAVVTLVIGEALFRLRPSDDEGVLSARRASIVSAAGLARIARRIDLGDALRLGEGESRRDGRTRVSLLASGLEALVGAIYLDLGYAAVREWLLGLAEPELTSDAPLSSLKSAKSRLQE
ncbi:MAG TPA: ribonuclease III domain-containing protein, partial [Patescibacteria group bacterium]|nr:ribonuclease III domain-containing protein [Patescibacteria group bacterium]